MSNYQLAANPHMVPDLGWGGDNDRHIMYGGFNINLIVYMEIRSLCLLYGSIKIANRNAITLVCSYKNCNMAVFG